tara:strand:+ start:553 stop:1488 length:936 start_codon:yes stop_codon:yes gene_type:complete
MARHLYIGNDVAVSYSSGVLANGAVDIQKLSSSGPTPMLPGDTIADSSQFRIVQGNGTTNIVSPWVYGKDVINWSGKSYTAAAAHTSTITPVTTSAAAAKEIEVKLTRLDGPTPEFFKFNVDIAGSSAINTAGAAILAAYNALTNIPDWLNPTATGGAPTVTFVGSERGDTCQSGNTWDEGPAIFNVVVSINPTTTQTYTAANGVVDGIPGYGDGFHVKAMEEELRGAQYGYYNRVQLPVTPTQTAVTGDTYDMYHIAATKDGSTNSQIKGVDNIIELNIAFDNGTAALTSALEGVLNPYLLSAGFANVNL